MQDELDADTSLLEDVKDSLVRQISEMQKLIERKRGEVRTLELELSKGREQRTAKMIIAVLKRSKLLQGWTEALADGRESWEREVAASTAALDCYSQAISMFKSQQASTLHTLLALLPPPPVVLHTLREAHTSSGRVRLCVTDEEISGRNGEDALERKETTMRDGQMREVVLSQELQAMIEKEKPRFPSSSQHRPLHLKTQSCHQPTFPLDQSSQSISFLFDLRNTSMSLPDYNKDSSLEEENNRLAILNSSIRIAQRDQDRDEGVEAREEDVGLQSPRSTTALERAEEGKGWRRVVCPCLWRN